MLPALIFSLVIGLWPLPGALADTYCDASVPCAIGCCGKYNVCGMGPDYCGTDNCINNCDAKAECNPGDWPSQYVNATTCPLNVCCSKYGFCGTTEEFCGTSTVTRPSCDASSQSITRVIGYYNSAAASRSCDGMQPASVPQGVYSHIYFAFGSIDPNTFAVLPAMESDKDLYPQLAALQSRDLSQELWLSIGGWDFSNNDAPTATTFSDLAAAPTAQQNAFFNSLINFMNTYGFTGIDIDWEYPAAGDRNGRAEDYANFPKFLANLKKALAEYKFGLSITLPTSYWYLQHFDLVSIEPSVDWFNFMSYDLHGTWDIGNEWTGAFLDAHTNLTEIETALDLLWRNNITSTKVNMGLAFYGRSFTLASSSCSGAGCEYLSAGDEGECSGQAGILFNSEISQLISDNDLTPTLYKDAAVKTITWNGDQWVSFDDQDTWKIKADFAKSECLGGVLVWSIDNDDTNHTYSKGLAAALGNEINIDIDTGITPATFYELSASVDSTSGNSQDQYCRFINCGETCPNGFTTVTRADKTSQLMLDSTECPPLYGTQTLCCPTTTEVPTCQWRGFHNSGKCKGGCNADEAEVGTIGAGCRSGYQSACCTITSSTSPWSKCAWTSSCESDDTCPSGYSNFIVGSRDGWGGRPSCSGSEKYNYCCSGSAVPDAFTNCEWKGHETTFKNFATYCSDTCPSGSIRIAEQALNELFESDKTAHTSNCLYGNEAYCCSGPKQTVVPRDSGSGSTITYKDQTAKDFDAYLQKFLADPVCPLTWEAEYSANFDLVARDSAGILSNGFQKAKRANIDQAATLTALLPLLVIWVSTEHRRTDLDNIWDTRLEDNGLTGLAANASQMETAIYESVNPWTGVVNMDPTALIADELCNIADSSSGLSRVSTAASVLCSVSDNSTLSSRSVSVVGTSDRSDNECEPSIMYVITGIMNGELSLHYLRWINADGRQVILELAYWMGPNVGVADSTVRYNYGDRSHTAATDRWVVLHLHIPLDVHTFESGATSWNIGVSTMGIYHSQGIQRPSVVTRGATPDYRAEFRYSRTYARGQYNVGTMRNYNSRAETISCNFRRASRWYIGRDETDTINGLGPDQASNVGYARLLNSFGLWLHNQGIFSVDNLSWLFPTLDDYQVGDGWRTVINAWTILNPRAGAFDYNWLPDGTTPPDVRNADS